jgi:muconolactone delta-isomerase
MKQFMVQIDLPDHFTEEFIRKIPKQRAHVNFLINKKIINNYALSMDRTQLWVTINAASEQEVHDVLSSFPLIDFMDVHIHELLFHESVQYAMPEISLN